MDEFKDLEGFDENFLGVTIPLPTLTPAQKKLLPKVAGAADGVLRYVHYSSLFNSSRKFPFCNAVNIDGSKTVTLDCSVDEWFKDPRISPDIQFDAMVKFWLESECMLLFW